eukprot:356995-Chlamydomonas_euryale.AAC.4
MSLAPFMSPKSAHVSPTHLTIDSPALGWRAMVVADKRRVPGWGWVGATRQLDPAAEPSILQYRQQEG